MRLRIIIAASLLIAAGVRHQLDDSPSCDPTVYADGTPAPCLTQEEERVYIGEGITLTRGEGNG